MNPTEQEKENYYNFFHALKYILPCEKCRVSMIQHMQTYPLDEETLSSRDNMIRWGIDIHNSVNENTGRPVLSYDDAITQIRNMMRSRLTNTSSIVATIPTNISQEINTADDLTIKVDASCQTVCRADIIQPNKTIETFDVVKAHQRPSVGLTPFGTVILILIVIILSVIVWKRYKFLEKN